MKKILMSLLCLIAVCTARAPDDDDRPIRIDQLPEKAQSFIREHFKGVKVALAKMESDFFDRSYDVIFTNGNKVEFDRHGQWEEIECKYTEVPSSAVPEFIRRYVAENHADQKIWKLGYKDDRRFYEVKLSNRWELTFDLKGNLVDLDRD